MYLHDQASTEHAPALNQLEFEIDHDGFELFDLRIHAILRFIALSHSYMEHKARKRHHDRRHALHVALLLRQHRQQVQEEEQAVLGELPNISLREALQSTLLSTLTISSHCMQYSR